MKKLAMVAMVALVFFAAATLAQAAVKCKIQIDRTPTEAVKNDPKLKAAFDAKDKFKDLGDVENDAKCIELAKKECPIIGKDTTAAKKIIVNGKDVCTMK
jgi:hypothetical protein